MTARAGTSPGPLDRLPPAGRSSALVRDLRLTLSDAAARARRAVVIAEGVRLAEEALRRPEAIRLVLASPRLLKTAGGAALAERIAAGPFPARRVEDALLASLSRVESHQGILLLVERPTWTLDDLLREPYPPLVLAACAVQDPGNLGALARIAEAAWAGGLLCAGEGADPWSARSVRASAGSLLRRPVVSFPSAAAAAGALRSRGLALVGASPSARSTLRDAPLGGPLTIFVGGEGAGLPPSLEGMLDAVARIPMREGVESLNVAAAAAVILFEAASRRGKP